MISLYHFQQRYGLLKGETPVNTPLAYPRLQHNIMLHPVKLTDSNLYGEFISAKSHYERWFDQDKCIACRISITSWEFCCANNAVAQTRAKIPLDKLHSRLAHHSSHAIIYGQMNGLYTDAQVIPTPDEFCETCQISKIRYSDRGRPCEPPVANLPGQIMCLDSQLNPVHGGLTSSTSFKDYLTICDFASHTFRAIGMRTSATGGVIDALDTFVFENATFPGFNLKYHYQELHVDAGSNLISTELKQWCKAQDIHCIAAAPHHQEMNDINEQNCQTACQMVFSMCNAARLGFPYFHHALQYACCIMDVLPAKCCKRFRITKRSWEQSIPEIIWKQIGNGCRIKKYFVFGCSVVFKVHQRKTPKDPNDSASQTHLTSKNIFQHGVRFGTTGDTRKIAVCSWTPHEMFHTITAKLYAMM